MQRFLIRLQGRQVCKDVDDKVLRVELKNGNFFVKTLYKTLEPRRQCVFPTIVIWKSWVLSRVGFFAQEATWNKFLTQNHIQKRRWSLANKCFLCLIEEKEFIDHIPIHCYTARVLWKLLFSLFCVLQALPSSVKETFLGWHGSFVGKKKEKDVVGYSLMPFLNNLEGKKQ